MIKQLLAAFSIVLTLTSGAVAWEEPKRDVTVKDVTIYDVHWEGETDYDFLKMVRNDIERARSNKEIKTLRVVLMSGGGPVVTSWEIARTVRAAADSGLVVEIHGRGLVASGGTFVLAAGTPGRRYITKEAIVLVHGVQSGRGCLAYTKEAKTEDEKLINAVLNIGRDLYIRLTTQTKAVVEKWLTCGNEQAGDGSLAVELKLADIVN